MTEEEAIAIYEECAIALHHANRAFALAEQAHGLAPIQSLRDVRLTLSGCKLACIQALREHG